MRLLVALDLVAGPAFVSELQRAWDNGDAVLPLDQRLPIAAKKQLVADLRAAVVIDSTGTTRLQDSLATENGDALIVPTSGTTGIPKAAILTHRGISASALASSRALNVDEDDHWLACLPLSHVGGLSVVTRALLTKTRLTVIPEFDASQVSELARQCTLVSLVPTALQRIDARLFRAILLGGSRPPQDRPGNVIATYGMTETGSGVVYDGRALLGVEISFTQDNEILLRSPMAMRQYRDGTSIIDPQGWLHTGDSGRLLADGRLHVDGRRGDVIVTGGEKVWPETIEQCVADLFVGYDFAVLGYPDPEWGQRLVIATTAQHITLDQVRAKVKETLPAFCAPKQIRIVTAIPRSELGKIIRSDLAQMITI